MKVTKAAREALRKELEGKGHTPQDIALVMIARYRVRPRVAFRWAHGMTLGDVAIAWNQQDASGRAPMTTTRVSDYERWPDGGKRPTAYVLLMLAKLYGTAIAKLLDDRDYASLNEKQLFETIELCRRNADDQPATPASATAPQPPAAPPQSGEQRPHEEPDNQQMPRRTVLEAISAMASGSYLESIELVRQAEASDLGPRTLEQLDLTIERFGLEYLHTPLATMLEEVRCCRQYVTDLLSGKQTLAQKAHLYSVAGWLSGLLGILAFDMGEHATIVEGHHVTALHLASEAGDADLTAFVRGTQAMVATYGGHPDEAVRLSQAGREIAPAGSATGVRLWGQELRAYGRMDKRGPAEHAMAAADREFDSLAQPPNGSIFSFDRPYLPCYAGTAYVGLRKPTRAQECAEQAITLCDAAPADWPVTRVLARVDLATALGQQGDLDGAGKLGVEALHICAAGRRAYPSVKRIAELLKALQPHHDVAAIRDLNDLFHEVFPAGSGGPG